MKIDHIDEEIPKVTQGTVKQLKNRSRIAPIDRIKLKYKADCSYLITMLFSNGTCKQFVISTREETFTYKGREYFLRYEDAWFDITYNQFRLFYHDDTAIPINREIQLLGDEKWFSVRPENLKPLLKMEYVKVLAQSQELSKYLKTTLIIVAIVGLIALGNLILTYQQGGGI